MAEWRRWLTAERDERDDDADAELRAVFRSIPPQAPRQEFAARVAEAVARDARRRARVTRLALFAASAAAIVASVVVLWQLPRLFRPMFDAGVSGLVWSLAAVDRGIDVWTLIGRMARVTAAIVVTPQVTLLLMALAVVAIAALYGLNRVLELEERSSS
jgi:hypothetical protein